MHSENIYVRIKREAGQTDPLFDNRETQETYEHGKKIIASALRKLFHSHSNNSNIYNNVVASPSNDHMETGHSSSNSHASHHMLIENTRSNAKSSNANRPGVNHYSNISASSSHANLAARVDLATPPRATRSQPPAHISSVSTTKTDIGGNNSSTSQFTTVFKSAIAEYSPIPLLQSYFNTPNSAISGAKHTVLVPTALDDESDAAYEMNILHERKNAFNLDRTATARSDKVNNNNSNLNTSSKQRDLFSIDDDNDNSRYGGRYSDL